ncbi:MAG: endonuclease III [Planctomycetes bacterium]|nr:endonuclease III [Planctomycetota bacterium]
MTAAEESEEKRRLQRIFRKLDRLFLQPRCELDHEGSFQLLVAVILSAQCTDKRVNMVTPFLFARFPDAAAMARADLAEVEELVKSTGFFRNKAKNIVATARRLVADFGGEVPADMAALLSLPGVARKTANVVLGECFGIAEGIVVDTHVARLSKLLGLTEASDPVRIERELIARVPRSRWIKFAHQLILHGRRTCIARRPNCAACLLRPDCPSARP